MKRIYSLAILFVLLVNGTGFYVYYFLQLQQIRNEMRAALKLLPVDQLEVLSLTRQAFEEGLVEAHEIEVDNRMYDIAWVEYNENGVVVYCKHDEKEDNLLALLDFVVNGPENDGSGMPLSVYQIIGLIAILPFHQQPLHFHAETVRHLTPYQFQFNQIRYNDFFIPPRPAQV